MFAMEKAQAEQAREEARKMQQRQMLANRCCESLAVFRNKYNLALDDGKSILLGPFMTPQVREPAILYPVYTLYTPFIAVYVLYT